ncbi:MAG: hypothetical protein AB1483_11300 [Candidatus Zixiibacteriota bacterium]
MKINPVAIQSYQQTVRRDDAATRQLAQENQSDAAVKKVNISPQNAGEESRVSVRASVGSYAEILTPEEKNALDILFSRFRDSARFGPGYQQDSQADSESNLLGGMVDVKV